MELYNPITGETVDVEKGLGGKLATNFLGASHKVGEQAERLKSGYRGLKATAESNNVTVPRHLRDSAVASSRNVVRRNPLKATGGAALAGAGAGYAVNKAVSPMFGAKDAFANQPTKKERALLPTGGHVSHANALKVVHNRRRKNVGRFGDTGLKVVHKAEALPDLSMQPGMINPGVVSSSWSHGTPNQNFAAQSGRRGSKIR